MKSGKQRRRELDAKRKVRREKNAAERKHRQLEPPQEAAPVNRSNLAPYFSLRDPEFVYRGYYLDQPFTCQGCGKEEVWTAHQQKWWYEIAKGDVWTKARFCRPCRRRERERKSAARRVHLEGVARKKRGSS